MSYDFKSLSPIDFEDLARELIGAELGIRFEGFAPGPDGGVDGRHSSGEGDVILQAKHYADSGYAALKSRLKSEKAKIDQLSPSRYILATSTPLTPKRKQELMAVLAPYVLGPADIYGPTELNALLKHHPDIEKAQIKLWLTSTAVLEQLLRAATRAKTQVTLEDITKKIRLYVPNQSLNGARTILEREHVVIISGAPGVGKTTLAEMLAHMYAGDGYEIVTIDNLDSGFEEIVDAKKQLFFFDDFLGRVRLNEDAIRYRDSKIAAFIKRVKMSPNARFILTTRQYILERARQMSESFADERISLTKYVLDVGTYTRRVRARIIYNHLLYSKLPVEYVGELVARSVIAKLIDHPHFNPRLIEWMTDPTYLGDISASDYPDKFLATFDHPERLWDHAFRSHIQIRAQHLLIALYFYEYGTSINRLRTTYEMVHGELSRRSASPTELRDFEVALRELEGSFVSISGQTVSFINPSVADYLSTYIASEQIVEGLARVIPSARWAQTVWRFGIQNLNAIGIQEHRLAGMFEAVAADLPKFEARLYFGLGGANETDLSLPQRISLLLEWWEAGKTNVFSDTALAIARKPPVDYARHWDAQELAGVLMTLKDDTFEKMPHRSEIVTLLDRISSSLILGGSLEATRIKNFREVYQSHGADFSSECDEALHRAIQQEIENVDDFLRSIDSAEEVDIYEQDLRENARWAGIVLPPDFDEYFESRREAINDETAASSDPEPVKEKSSDTQAMSDDEIQAMFADLVSHLTD